jgi:hypothetical protein
MTRATAGLFARSLLLARSADIARGEWPAYAGDTWPTKYSPLDQIITSNLKNLRIVSRHGLLLISTAARTVAALDPVTGHCESMPAELLGLSLP